ncbi:tetratricopeptide repeat protein [Chitinophaga japonensis]|uniref:WD40 repeat protein n=1 Tax=Chitinophaga japonensis TaxID=104662 RepID=A0A562SP73_CHIJA|nr:CDC27 family protein [Chitinophaga japonensis]TWI82490.1 WD40 repeat protein [Chitinophaga japonensis]
MKQLFLTIVFTSLLLSVYAQEQPRVRRQADEHFMRYEYGNAALLYEDLIKHRSKVDPEVITRLAYCYRKMNAYEKAAQWYAKATADATHAKAEDWLYYGDALKSLGRYEEAVAQYNKYAQQPGADQARVKDRIAGCDSAKIWLASPDTDFVLRNAAPANTSYADWGGIFYKTSYALFTSDSLRRDELSGKSKRYRRSYGWTMQDYARLYLGREDKYGRITIRDLSPRLNKFKYHIGPLAYTADYDTVYFTITNPDRPHGKKMKGWPVYGTRRLMVFYSVNKNGAWQKPVPFAYNRPDSFSVGHVALSADGSVLYFASDMPGGYGETDIWYCEKQPDSTWGTPKNCGPVINTPEQDEFPTVSGGNVFYYASKGHAGMGGFDIFEASGARDQWSAPVNLHVPRNSPADDFFYTVIHNEKGFLSSNREGGKGDDDIYFLSFNPEPLRTPIKPLLTIKLEGSTCPNFLGCCVYLYNKQRGIGWCYLLEDGHFEAMLEADTEYEIRVYVNGTLRQTIPVDTHGVQDATTIEKLICPGQQ